MNRKVAVVTLILFCMLAGGLISIQVHSQEYYSTDLSRQSISDLVILLHEANKHRLELANQQRNVAESVSRRAAESLTEAELLSQLQQEQTTLHIANADCAVTGSGVTICFEDDSSLLSNDLLNILNELWGTGAEAIAVNDIRITNTSSFSTTVKNHEVKLTIDNQPLFPPIYIRAIGNSDDLVAGVTFPGGIIDNLRNLFNVQPVITKEKELTLPAA